MENKFEKSSQLSHGAIKDLIEYEINENKRIIHPLMILQLYKCYPISYNGLYSCHLFDTEYICNQFLLKYNPYEGIPSEGDIILITKIIINVLNDGNRFFYCEGTKLLEKGEKFRVNPTNLKYISINQSKNANLENKEKNINDKKENIKTVSVKKEKVKIDILNNKNAFINKKNNESKKEESINNILIPDNNINKIKEEKNNIVIPEHIIDELKEEVENNKLIQNDDNNFNYNIIKKEEINNKIIKQNDDDNNIDNLYIDERMINLNGNISDNLYNEIFKSQNDNNDNLISFKIEKSQKNTLKIEPKKKEKDLNINVDEIMESINTFIDDFEDENEIKDNFNENDDNDINKYLDSLIENEENNNSIKLTNNNEINKSKKDRKNKNNKIVKEIPYNNKIMSKGCLNIKYIKEINDILKSYKNKPFIQKFKIKCRIKTLFNSKEMFYKGCSICRRKIRDNKKSCQCKNKKEILIYDFYTKVRDISGEVTVFFINRVAKKLLGIEPVELKELIDNKNFPPGNILYSEFVNDFYNFEYLLTIDFHEFKDPSYICTKKFHVTNIEKIKSIHYHQIVNNLKNILKIN